MLTKQEKQEWIDALKSGKYVQGGGVLHNTEKNTWCCLGVLCDLQAKKFNLSRVIRDGVEFFNDYPTTLPGCFLLSSFWDLHELGMPNLKNFATLAAANDGGVSFQEIANHIEKYLPTSDA